jgi:hypothetical protein
MNFEERKDIANKLRECRERLVDIFISLIGYPLDDDVGRSIVGDGISEGDPYFWMNKLNDIASRLETPDLTIPVGVRKIKLKTCGVKSLAEGVDPAAKSGDATVTILVSKNAMGQILHTLLKDNDCEFEMYREDQFDHYEIEGWPRD